VRAGEGDGFVDGGVFGDAGLEELVETEAEEILGLRLDGAAAEAVYQFVEEVKIADDTVEEILREAAIGRGEALPPREIVEEIGGVAGGVLPVGEGVEGAAAGGHREAV